MHVGRTCPLFLGSTPADVNQQSVWWVIWWINSDCFPTWSWGCQRVASENIFSFGSFLAYCNFPSGRQSITALLLNHSHLSFMTYLTGWSVVFPVLLVMVVKAICHNKFTFAGGKLTEKRMSRNKWLPPWSQLATNLPLTAFWKAVAPTGRWNPYISNETVIVPRD